MVSLVARGASLLSVAVGSPTRHPAFKEFAISSDGLEEARAPEPGRAGGALSYWLHDHRQVTDLSRSPRGP